MTGGRILIGCEFSGTVRRADAFDGPVTSGMLHKWLKRRAGGVCGLRLTDLSGAAWLRSARTDSRGQSGLTEGPMTELYLIAALLFAAAGWLAFAKEKRAHQLTQGRLWASRRELTRLTDRDARGRFVKREGAL